MVGLIWRRSTRHTKVETEVILPFFFHRKCWGGTNDLNDVESSKDFLWYEQKNHFHSSSLPGPSPDFLVLLLNGGFNILLSFFPRLGKISILMSKFFKFCWFNHQLVFEEHIFFLDPETICEICETERLW